MGLNDEVDQEFGTTEEKKEPINLYTTDKVATNEVDENILFNNGSQPRRLPELNATFVIQKSKEDRLVEFVDKAIEIESSGGISRNDVMAIESIYEDLTGDEPEYLQEDRSKKYQEENNKPLVEDQVSTEDTNTLPKREPILGNPKLYTEDKSKTEYKQAIQTLHTTYEKQYNDVKTSSLKLIDLLVVKGKEELQEQQKEYIDKVNIINKKIIEFLENFESNDLEKVRCTFKNNVRWSDLLDVNVNDQFDEFSNERVRDNKILDMFHDTKAETFITEIRKFFNNRNNKNIFEFINRITNPDLLYDELYKRILNKDNDIARYKCDFNILDIFRFIGSSGLNTFINESLKLYQEYIFSLKEIKENINKIEPNNNNHKENLDNLLIHTGKIHDTKNNMMQIMLDISTIFILYEIVIKFLCDLMKD